MRKSRSSQSWPALIIGFILLIYWLRVLHMVRKAKAHGNFIPRERTGRLLRIIWNPVVILWVLLPLVTAFYTNPPSALRPLYYNAILAWIAVAVAIIAFAITWVCWKRMGTSWRMGIDPEEKTQLVFTGPFAYVRHPIYALSSVLMLMTMIIVPSAVMIVVGVLHLLLLQWEVSREEKYLVSVHGEQYSAYRGRVGRFIPRSLRAYTSSS